MSTPWSRRLITAVTAGCVFVGSSVAAASGPVAAASSGRAEAAHLTRAQRAVLVEATWWFQDVSQAIAAGYLPTNVCVPGMGYHYAHPALIGDVNIDPTLPEMLVYARSGPTGVRMVALEFFRADADGNKATAGDRPTLFGHPFDGPMDGHAPSMPVHYDLHVWLYRTNPAGMLTAENPRIHCP